MGFNKVVFPWARRIKETCFRPSLFLLGRKIEIEIGRSSSELCLLDVVALLQIYLDLQTHTEAM